MGDELRLRQILANLVSNAIKFTSRGRVELRVVRLETRATAEILQFSVVDTGMGISTEAQKTLFQPFSQAGRDISTRFGGTGLGLSICQRLASLMGGTIGVSSEEGNGTAITLTLPFPIADPAALELAREAAVGGGRESLGPRRAAPSAESAAMEGTLVLVVDDHPINRMVLVRQLNALGYATEVAEDGIEALGKWRHGRFGLVVTDCNMPEMDGYGLVSAIREIEAAEGRGRTPVMAYTANALQGEAENCLAAGMDDYVAKPVEFGVLARKLEQWVPIPGLRSPLDAAMLAEISGGDVELGRKFLARFSEFNREDTVRLLEAIAQRDFASMRRIAHRMKGSSRTVGANTLGDACELIERAARSGDWARVQARVPALNAEIARLDAYLVQT
jgi:two-component system sensor histidine kinase EvgS